MANEELVELLRSRLPMVWNEYRAAHPDLSGADLRRDNLARPLVRGGADLSLTDLRGANMEVVDNYRIELLGTIYNDATKWSNPWSDRLGDGSIKWG